MAHVCSSLSNAFSSLALSASQNDTSSSSTPFPASLASLGTPSLAHDTILQLHESFGSFQPPCSSSSMHYSPSSNAVLDPALWEELASQGVSLASVVQGLTAGMEKGGKLGIVAADVYLGMMLAPGCPLYSLFSQIAFNAMLRCIRNSCKPSPVPDQPGSGAAAEKTRKGKGGKARRKRPGGKQIEVEDSGDFDSESLPGDEDTPPRTTADAPSLQDIFRVLARLQSALLILHLREHQESLRTLLELLVEFPNLVSEIQSEDDAAGQGRGPRARRMAVQASPSQHSASRLTFDLMKTLLQPVHGDQVNTAVILLKLLAPSILLIRAGGSNHQRAQIREQALHFITVEMKSLRDPALRSAVIALPRYLAMKAPEKTEPRAQAEEAVMAIVKSLGLENQRKFGHFVAKLSRGKPRHRLFAVDLSVALLGAVPDPLGLDKDAEQGDEERNSEEPDDHMYCSEKDAPVDKERAANIEGETVLANGDEQAAREPGINCPPRSDSEDCTPSSGTSGTKVWWGTACLEALLHRCSDKVPSIRARALTNLAQVLELLSTNIQNRAILQNLLGFGIMPPAGSKEQEFSIRKSAIFNAWQTPGHGTPSLGGQTPSPEPSAPGPGASPLSPGAGHGDLGSLLKKRCVDEKVAVRKSTLFLMMKSASLLGRPPDDTMLEAMGSACADPMVSIRKAALGALSEVMRRFPADTKIVTEWLQSALPLVMDNESSIQEECSNLFEELTLDRLAAVAALRLPGCTSKFSGRTVIDGVTSYQDAEQELERLLPPGIMLLLKGVADGGSISSCVKRICTCLGSKKRLRAGIALALQNIITASRTLWCSQSRGKPFSRAWTAPAGAWFLLAEVSAFVPKAVGWEFLRNHWQLLEKQENLPTRNITPETEAIDLVQTAAWATDRVHLLQTISNVAIELPPDAAADLAAELLERLEGFGMHPTEVGAHVKALNTLCYRKAACADKGENLVRIWVEQLLEKAGAILNSYISMCSSSDQPPTETFETPKPSRSQRKGAIGSARPKEKSLESISKDSNPPSCQIITAIFTMGALVLICPKARIENLVALLQALITSSNSRSSDVNVEGPASIHEDIASGVHAQAWVTLGKMCLANQDLAKRCIPLFLQELEKTESAAVRNNIMVAMTDFCIRYTSLVDGHIHKLTKSLRDPCELVRRQGFVLLARLLQRDYLKWRGTLFHRFLLALVDESEKICHMANFLFGSILKAKAPLLAYNSFVETIFVLNDCRAHAGHNAAMLQTSESERELFSLRGNTEAVVKKRIHIYTCLLKQMAPEHILATSAKLCADILAAAADGLLDLDNPTAQCVLEDSLKILASKEMRIGGNRGSATTDNLDMDEERDAAFAAVKGRVVTQLAKRNLVQNAIPIFIELKRMLETKNSPLTGMLMECMRTMLKEYKNEIEEILVADKQLQKEIMYDMQKHEAAKAKAKVVAAATVVGSPGSGLRQRNSSSNQVERSTSATAPAHSLTEPPKKTPVRENSKERRRNYATGKENIAMQSGDLTTETLGKSNKSSLNPSSKRKTLLSPTLPQPSRVKWLDQTPGFQSRIMHPASGSRTPGLFSATPKPSGSKKHVTTSDHRGRSGEEGRLLVSPGKRAHSQDQIVASAVADVVATATAAAVLNEVARGTSTPLQTMSIPKLHCTVPSTVKKASFQSNEGNDGFGGLSQDEAIANLNSVRRRQSFSSISVPIGSDCG